MMHYYLIAPVLLLAARPAAPGFRRRVAIGCGGVLALSLAYRTWGTLQTDLDLPVKFFSDAPADMMNAFLLIVRSPLRSPPPTLAQAYCACTQSSD